MRHDEAFVARSLVNFLGGSSFATASEGDDPPDIYLNLSGARIGVEVTRLSQFSIDPDGVLGNRVTQDRFGLRLLDELDATLGPLLPNDTSLFVGLWVPVQNAARFRKNVGQLVEGIARSPVKGTKHEHMVDGERITVSVIDKRPSGQKIVGFVFNKNSSADIGLNVRLILSDRIITKNQICADMQKPVWLALFNDYWIADEASYISAYQQLDIEHCFEKVFLVTGNGTVTELKGEA